MTSHKSEDSENRGITILTILCLTKLHWTLCAGFFLLVPTSKQLGLDIFLWIFLSHIKKTAEYCQICSQQQENIWCIQVRLAPNVQEAGDNDHMFTAYQRQPKDPESHCFSKLTSSSASSTCMAPLFHPDTFAFCIYLFFSVVRLL